MPDLQSFSVTRNGTVSLANVPQWTISFMITNSTTGAVLRNFTGANAKSFPQVFASLSAVDQDELVNKWVQDIIRKVAPDLFT
jgi:hypothetical protein